MTAVEQRAALRTALAVWNILSLMARCYTMTAVELSADDRAAAGAAWLDDVYPEWWQHVHLDRFDMGSGCHCVAGQTFGDPADPDVLDENGFDALMTVAEFAGEDSPVWLAKHGFLLAHHDRSWQALDRAWRGEILRRRGTEGVYS